MPVEPKPYEELTVHRILLLASFIVALTFAAIPSAAYASVTPPPSSGCNIIHIGLLDWGTSLSAYYTDSASGYFTAGQTVTLKVTSDSSSTQFYIDEGAGHTHIVGPLNGPGTLTYTIPSSFVGQLGWEEDSSSGDTVELTMDCGVRRNVGAPLTLSLIHI